MICKQCKQVTHIWIKMYLIFTRFPIIRARFSLRIGLLIIKKIFKPSRRSRCLIRMSWSSSISKSCIHGRRWVINNKSNLIWVRRERILACFVQADSPLDKERLSNHKERQSKWSKMSTISLPLNRQTFRLFEISTRYITLLVTIS